MKILDLGAFKESINEDLSRVTKINFPIDTNRISFISHLIQNLGSEFWTEEILNRLCKVQLGRQGYYELESDLNNIFEFKLNNKTELFSLFKILFSLFCSASRKGLVSFNFQFTFHNMFYNSLELLNGDYPYSFCFSQDFKELLNVSTERKFNHSKEYISDKWQGLDKVVGTGYKSWNKSCSDIARYMMVYQIESVDSLDAYQLNVFRKGVLDSGLGNIGVHSLLRFLDNQNDTSITEEYSKLSKSDVLLATKSGLAKKSGQKTAKGLKAKELAGELIDDKAVVYTWSKNYNIFKVGEYSIEMPDVSYFSIDKLKNKSIWLDCMNDYLSFTKYEKSTLKSKRSRLKYFNVYLFSYLPFFFKNNNTIFKYPDTPEKFLNYVFVQHSKVIDSSIDCDKNIKIYPVSLIDFITGITGEAKLNSSNKNNLARDTLREVKSLFDFIMLKYSVINGCKLSINPLNGNYLKIGFKYSKSVKARLSFTYWIAFRVFAKNVARFTLLQSITNLFNAFSEVGDIVNRAIAKELFIEIAESSEYTRDYKVESFTPLVFDAKSMDLNGDSRAISISNLKISDFKKRYIQINKEGVQIQIVDFMTWVAISVACYAGHRNSNIMWLDADNFDMYHDYGRTYSKTELCSLYVATDKIQESGIDGKIEYDVMQLLIFSKKIRNFNVSKNFMEPIYYQGNENSNFGKLRPLLQTTETNTPLDYNLLSPIKLFEECLNSNAIEFDSHIFFGQKNKKAKDSQVLNYIDIINNEFDSYINNSGQKSDNIVPFTQIDYKCIHTMHSLRKSLVTVLDVLSRDSDVIKQFTGQSKTTQSYYSDAEPNEVKLINGRYATDESIANIKGVSLDKAEVEKSILHNRFGKDFKGVTINTPNWDSSNGIDDIQRKTTIHELAFNWTHICTLNNICSREIKINIGEKKCYGCHKAVITKHHAPAILSKIKNLEDEIRFYNNELNNEFYSDEDIEDIHFKINELVLEASSWKVRLNFINDNPEYFIGVKTSAVDNYSLQDNGSLENQIIARLIEVKNVPALQSSKIKAMARKLSKSAIGKLKTLEGEVQIRNHQCVVSNAINNLSLLAELQGVSINKLLTSHDFNQSEEIYLELFSD